MSTKTVHERLSKFMDEEINLVKTKSAHQYKYSPLDDIMDIVRPLLSKHGLLLYHETEYNQEMDKEFVITTLVCTDNSKSFIRSQTQLQYGIKIGSMNPVMVIGAQITYIRRYHVVTLLGLTTEEDTDVNPTSSASGEIPAQTASGPDYMLIFENQIKKGVAQDKLKKSLKNYEQKMDADLFKNISDMIEEHFKSKK